MEREDQAVQTTAVGYRFRPTEQEMLKHYLFNKLHGLPYTEGFVFDFDIYGATEPWELFGGGHGQNLFFFTKLKRSIVKSGSSSLHVCRKVGSSDGCWSGEDAPTSVFDAGTDHIIGFCKRFRYENARLPDHNGEWIMHEYCLQEGLLPPHISADDCYVLCHIKKNEGRKRKSERQEEDCDMAVITSDRLSAVGVRFVPTDQELLRHYLINKLHGIPYFEDVVFDVDLYGSLEPWDIWKWFNGVDGHDLYFFTKLKRSTTKCGQLSANVSRKVGPAGGTWSGEGATAVYAAGTDQIIGYYKRLRYENRGLPERHGEWIMHEYSLHKSLLPHDDGFVLCRIRKNDRPKKKLEKRRRSSKMADPNLAIQIEQTSKPRETINQESESPITQESVNSYLQDEQPVVPHGMINQESAGNDIAYDMINQYDLQGEQLIVPYGMIFEQTGMSNGMINQELESVETFDSTNSYLEDENPIVPYEGQESGNDAALDMISSYLLDEQLIVPHGMIIEQTGMPNGMINQELESVETFDSTNSYVQDENPIVPYEMISQESENDKALEMISSYLLDEQTPVVADMGINEDIGYGTEMRTNDGTTDEEWRSQLDFSGVDFSIDYDFSGVDFSINVDQFFGSDV